MLFRAGFTFVNETSFAFRGMEWREEREGRRREVERLEEGSRGEVGGAEPEGSLAHVPSLSLSTETDFHRGRSGGALHEVRTHGKKTLDLTFY